HVLLQYDDPEGHAPWLNWKSWLELVGLPDLRPAGSLVLSGYEQIIPAAVAGQGVALGRSPLVRELIATGKLVKPFTRASESSRAYFALASKNAAGRVEVDDFLRWLRAEAAREEAVSAISRDLRAAKRKAHA
ncbi:MAG TPA: LysR substrate-binding domain-containing protein, partial [Burkholderiales bacterium]|nr:LysR substrate-binding domain-containing protein [Burkholderiales bacterium]